MDKNFLIPQAETNETKRTLAKIKSLMKSINKPHIPSQEEIFLKNLINKPIKKIKNQYPKNILGIVGIVGIVGSICSMLGLLLYVFI